MNKLEDDLFQVLEKILLRRYTCALEIHRMTEELKNAFDHNDTASSEILLGMREKEMEEYDVCNRNLEHICDEVEEEELYNLVFDRPCYELNGDNVEKLRSLVLRTKHNISKTIQIDQMISQRLAGIDSFYNLESK